jgi:integrase
MTAPGLVPLIEDYLAVRRGLGFQLDKPAALLADFARYADRIGHQGPITSDLAAGWVLSSSSGGPARAARLAAVRGFARHLATFEPATEIPPAGLFGTQSRRKQPHIYSDAEIQALLGQARLLQPRGGLCPRTYATLFSLLASTGIRLSEGCRLKRGDVDLAGGVLTVRATKFRKSRLVPMHPTTTRALIGYAAFRDAAVADPGARLLLPHRAGAGTHRRRRSANLQPTPPASGVDRGRTSTPAAYP